MTEEMPRPRLPYLRRETSRHGKICWYFRKDDGPRIRLRGEPGTAEFRAAYHAAMAGDPIEQAEPSRGTLRWLVERYQASGEFMALAESSRYFRGRFLRKAVERSGDKPFADINRRHIQAAMESRAKTPFEANNFLTAMNQMFAWAVDQMLATSNPCADVKAFKTKIVGHPTWPIDIVERYRSRHAVGTRARLAIDLLLFTGLRRADLTKLGRQHVKDEVISIRTGKTGAAVHVPIFAELRASIDATQTGDLTFLIAERGRPFQHPSSFTAWFRQRCDEAGIPEGYSAHGLRKAGATIAADAGATPHELMAMFGWARVSMAEVYTKEADKRRLARGAAERIANAFPPHPVKGAAGDPCATRRDATRM